MVLRIAILGRIALNAVLAAPTSSIASSPSRQENENCSSNTPSEPYPSAYARFPSSPTPRQRLQPSRNFPATARVPFAVPALPRRRGLAFLPAAIASMRAIIRNDRLSPIT